MPGAGGGGRLPSAASRRPVLGRGCWPWLALIAGLAWLFLLPAGACGLIIVAIALCALTERLDHDKRESRAAAFRPCPQSGRIAVELRMMTMR